jgi:hypothetical protein
MPGDMTIHRSHSADPTANALIDRLIEGWEAGSPVPLGALLPPEPAASMVADVACQEIRLKLRDGHPVRVADYLALYPQVAASDELVLYLLEAEVLGRKAHGLPPTLDEYVAEFPHLRAELERLFGVSRPALPQSPEGYELLEEIGRGGMGVIYRARDQALKRDVAIKVLQDRFAPDSSVGRRFVEEAQITGQLQHPGIPAIHQVGALADGRPFLAMKLIRGQTLAALVKSRSEINTLGVFESICQAVGYAHTRGVIHRDLKPENVMVGAFGEVQVMDWGLAKFIGAKPTSPTVEAQAEAPSTAIEDPRTPERHEQTGVAGTPWYMAPEQAAGEHDKIDPRSDVFALGGILCAMLTGKPPIEGANAKAAITNAIRGDTAAALARLAESGAEPELVAVCRRCLSADPPDRSAHAGEVAIAVANLRAEAEERAKRAELNRARRSVARWGTVAVMAALIVGAAVSVTFAIDARKQADTAHQEKGKADEASARANEDKIDAINSRTRAQRALARAILGPISAESPTLSDPERENVWRLVDLRSDSLGITFLEEATGNTVAVQQFRNRAEVLLHAVIGLSVSRRDEADSVIVNRLRDTTLPQDLRTDLAFVAAGTGRDGGATVEVVNTLSATLGKGPTKADIELWELPMLIAAAERLPALDAVETLLTALKRTEIGVERYLLSQGLSKVCQRLPNHRAGVACGAAADLLLASLEQATDGHEVAVLAIGLASVTQHIAENRSAEICRLVSDALQVALKKSAGGTELAALAEGATAVALKSPAGAAEMLVLALKAVTNDRQRYLASTQRQALVETLAAIAGRLPVDRRETQLGAAADVLLEALGKARDAHEIAELASELAYVIPHLSPNRALEVGEGTTTRLLTVLEKTGDDLSASGAAAGLAAVVPRLPPERRAEVSRKAADLLLVALANARAWDNRGEVARGLATVAPWVSPERRAEVIRKAADVLLAALRQRDHSSDRVFARIRAEVVVRVTNGAMGSGLTAIAQQLPADQKAEVLQRATDLLLGYLGKGSTEEDHQDVVLGLGLFAEWVPADRREAALLLTLNRSLKPQQLRFVSNGCASGLSEDGIYQRHHAPELATLTGVTSLHPDVLPKPRPLSPQKLVDLLKHPFCVKEARRAVLDALEFTYDRKFADLWEFVAFAEKEHPELDLLTPPKRPAKK